MHVLEGGKQYKHVLITDPELQRQSEPRTYQKYPCGCMFAHAYVCQLVCGYSVLTGTGVKKKGIAHLSGK